VIRIPNQNTKQLGINPKLIQTNHVENQAVVLRNLESKSDLNLWIKITATT